MIRRATVPDEEPSSNNDVNSKTSTSRLNQRNATTDLLLCLTSGNSPLFRKRKPYSLRSRLLWLILLLLLGAAAFWRWRSWTVLWSSNTIYIGGGWKYQGNDDPNKAAVVTTIPAGHQQLFQSHNRTLIVQSSVKSQCRNNAIVLLVQKTHATYARDSYGMLIQSLSLIGQHYISLNQHDENVDVFLFHTGDFDARDIETLEPLLGSSRRGILKLVDLRESIYWKLPSWHENDNQARWKSADIFPLGYRHMCRWFGIKIWDFFQDLNVGTGCAYRHIWRIDEDSLVWSPIRYDVFDYMKDNGFVYGFRLCAYEMDYNRYISVWFNKWMKRTNVKRDITEDLCGFYNNLFVADLQFFTSAPVQRYLKAIDRQGFVYRKRYGDLMIHSTAVYAFADPSQIHRFLDFTYQHVTTDHILHPEQGCVVWGGIQAGYNDDHATQTLDKYHRTMVSSKNCFANETFLGPHDLSPTYQHLPSTAQINPIRLRTVVAGKVESPGKGLLSG